MAKLIDIAICRRCWDTYSLTVKGSDLAESVQRIDMPCPTDLARDHWGADLSSPPPEWCPYALEHAVSAGMPKARRGGDA